MKVVVSNALSRAPVRLHGITSAATLEGSAPDTTRVHLLRQLNLLVSPPRPVGVLEPSLQTTPKQRSG